MRTERIGTMHGAMRQRQAYFPAFLNTIMATVPETEGLTISPAGFDTHLSMRYDMQARTTKVLFSRDGNVLTTVPEGVAVHELDRTDRMLHNKDLRFYTADKGFSLSCDKDYDVLFQGEPIARLRSVLTHIAHVGSPRYSLAKTDRP